MFYMSNLLIYNIVEYVEYVERNVLCFFYFFHPQNISTHFHKQVPKVQIETFMRFSYQGIIQLNDLLWVINYFFCRDEFLHPVLYEPIPQHSLSSNS